MLALACVQVGLAVVLAASLVHAQPRPGASSVASSQALATTTFRIHACKANGSGVLVTGLPESDGTYLMTALHVVQNCSNVEARVANCASDAEDADPDVQDPDITIAGSRQVLLWEELDLVLVELSRQELQKAWIAAPVVAEKSDLGVGEDVLILGVDAFNPCGWGFGNVRYSQSVKRMGRHMALATDYGPEDLKPLGDNATLLMMQSTGVPGVSGGGILDGKGHLIGMYQGGSPDGGTTTWGVRLSRRDLETFKRKQVKLNRLKSATPLLAQRAIEVEDRARGEGSLSEAAFVVGETGEDKLLGGAARVRYAVPLQQKHQWPTAIAVGFLAAFGRYQQSFFGPIGDQIIESHESYWGQLVGTAGIDFRALQRKPVMLGGSVDYRIGPRLFVDHPRDDPWVLVHGPTIGLRVCSRMTRLGFVCVEGEAALNRTQPQGFRYEIGSRSASDANFDWVPMLGLGASLNQVVRGKR